MPYHLATPQCGSAAKAGADAPALSHKYGVGNGARTHDTRNHNPVLCQLSYTHHMELLLTGKTIRAAVIHRHSPAGRWIVHSPFGTVDRHSPFGRTTGPAAFGCLGTPEGTRTPGPLLRRQLLYPPELQARVKCFSSPAAPAPYAKGKPLSGAPEKPSSSGPPRKRLSAFVGRGGAAERTSLRGGRKRVSAACADVERVMGIEPTRPAWKAGILPLNYTRVNGRIRKHQPGYDSIKPRFCQSLQREKPSKSCEHPARNL